MVNPTGSPKQTFQKVGEHLTILGEGVVGRILYLSPGFNIKSIPTTIYKPSAKKTARMGVVRALPYQKVLSPHAHKL